HWDRAFDTALADLVSVDVERHGAALGEPAAVVGELHPHLMLPGWDRRITLDLEALQAEQVVAVRRPALVCVEAPAGEGATLGDDHALGTFVGDDQLRRDGVGLV